MSRLLIFAPWTSGDAALWNSHWIARQTARLCAFEATVVEHDLAVREALESALVDEEVVGAALFGHGQPHAMMGVDGREALDATNAQLLGARWAHLMACNTGQELVPCCASHPGLFVGYSVSLVVEWTIKELSEEIQVHLARLVTATSFALLAGARAKPELRRRASAAADALVEWLLDKTEEGSYLGLHVLAEQLVDRMVVNR